MTSEHVLVNRENWDKDAPNWVERGRTSWAGEPSWGIWGVAESELGLLPDLEGLDAVMTDEPADPITIANVEDFFPALRLIEMKTTRKPIQDEQLLGFFFGATEREYAMARAMGDRYLFAFLVLTPKNHYGRPFAALLTLAEVERRTLSRRIQYQVNFRSDLSTVDGPHDASLVLLGDERDIPVVPSEPDALT